MMSQPQKVDVTMLAQDVGSTDIKLEGLRLHLQRARIADFFSDAETSIFGGWNTCRTPL